MIIKFTKESFISIPGIAGLGDLGPRLDRMFERVFGVSNLLPLVVREFVDTTAGSVSRFLPDGTKNVSKDYYFQKTDATANTVTITPFGTQTINGAASYVLAARYDRVTLIWNPTTASWFLQ